VQGKYYGHPNPYRKGGVWSPECVFKDGSYQGVAAPSNYVLPMYNLGAHKSADGIIEYEGEAFAGALAGDLLITNYSVGDDITDVRLSADGRSVVGAARLAGGFNNPLPITEGPDGTIYVGELGADKVTALVPTSGTWTTKQPMPKAVLDAGGRALGGKLCVIDGKTTAAHRSAMDVFDPTTSQWTTGPSLPGPAVENPAAVTLNGELYAFGGSTSAFSGAVNNAAVYDPRSKTWRRLAPMGTARAGATTQAIDGKIYVAGGMGGNGASLAGVEVYNPTTNTWSRGTAMKTRRDNPGSANLGGKLYVFGGRTRNADGTTVNGTLATVERYNPATDTWVARTPMPTGRRTMAVGTLGGRAQVMGGEKTGTGATFAANEEYDPLADTWTKLTPMPTPRHGAVAGTINGVVYVVGGGPKGGTSYTNVNEAFTP